MTALRITLAAFLSALPSLPAEKTIEFNRDVRPILSDKCFTCHGPDATAKKIPFRLDREEAAKADLGGHKAIVEGDADASTVVRRITSGKASQRMPPAYSGLKLSPAEIDVLRTWIAQGAKWQKHWSFIPPERKPFPAVKNESWARNGIDRFVLEGVERNNLKPSPEASRETLIRRVTLDITGLPPTPAEIDAFLNDKSSDAYEKVVDRLLGSTRYGERMAVRWLDAARYADTNGYQYDGERVMWRWRDWVIDAFNRNQHFDQFALEQIAGDLLPNATLAQKIATGFNRNHRANTEDGIVPEEYAVEYVVDRVETTSTVFLGVTLGCARCHNHKYDPFTQKEFYQMFAYFNNVPESGRAMKYGNSPPYVAAPTASQQAALDELLKKTRALEAKLDSSAQAIAGAQTKWERTAPKTWWRPESGLSSAYDLDDSSKLTVKDGEPAQAEGRLGKALRFDGHAYVDVPGDARFDINDAFALTAWINPDNAVDGSLLTRMNEGPKGKGYGVHLDKGKIHVNVTSSWEADAIRVETEETVKPGAWQHLAVTYNGSVAAAGIRIYLDGKPLKYKVLMDTLYRPFRNAGKPFDQPFRIGAGWGKDRRYSGLMDDVRVYSRVLGADEIDAMALGETIAAIAAKPESRRSTPEKNAIHWFYLEHDADPSVREIEADLTRLAREREALERTFPTVMVMAEDPAPHKTHLLVRGAYDKPGAEVDRGVPQVLNPLPAGMRNDRLALAKWIIDPANPLTSRVTVNRFWQMFFGAGLVKTIEDFGVQGDWPSNPDLLDWLSTEFVRTGWDVKQLVKLIVTSATYRQSSQVTPELMQKDPDNRLLARGPRHRVAPEMVRDQALAAAGLLTEKIGGRSVMPYQPNGLWKEQSMQDMEYVQSHGPDLYRRSLYTFWKRTIPPPMMVNFDAAGREACVVRETRTNTPLQALNLMNDVTFVEAARFIAQRMMKEGGASPDARLGYGFRLLTARQPRPEELKVLRDNLRYHLDYFASDAKRATEMLKQGEAPADANLKPAELAAYATVASLMLNLDEVITIQ